MAEYITWEDALEQGYRVNPEHLSRRSIADGDLLSYNIIEPLSARDQFIMDNCDDIVVKMESAKTTIQNNSATNWPNSAVSGFSAIQVNKSTITAPERNTDFCVESRSRFLSANIENDTLKFKMADMFSDAYRLKTTNFTPPWPYREYISTVPAGSTSYKTNNKADRERSIIGAVNAGSKYFANIVSKHYLCGLLPADDGYARITDYLTSRVSDTNLVKGKGYIDQKYQTVMNLNNFLYIHNTTLLQKAGMSNDSTTVDLGSVQLFTEEKYVERYARTFKLPGRIDALRQTNPSFIIDYDESQMRRELRFDGALFAVELPSDVTVDLDNSSTYAKFKSSNGNIKLTPIKRFKCSINSLGTHDTRTTICDVLEGSDFHGIPTEKILKNFNKITIAEGMGDMTAECCCYYDCNFTHHGVNQTFDVVYESDKRGYKVNSYDSGTVIKCTELNFKIVKNNDDLFKYVLVLESVKVKGESSSITVTNYDATDQGMTNFKSAVQGLLADDSSDGSGGSNKMYRAIIASNSVNPETVTSDRYVGTRNSMPGSQLPQNTSVGVFLPSIQIGCSCNKNNPATNMCVYVNDARVTGKYLNAYAEQTHEIPQTSQVQATGCFDSTLLAFGTDNTATYPQGVFSAGISHVLLANGSKLESIFHSGTGPEGVVLNKSTFIKGIKGSFFVANDSYATNGFGFVVNNSTFSRNNTGNTDETKCDDKAQFAMLINNATVTNPSRSNYDDSTNGILALNGTTYQGCRNYSIGNRLVIDSNYDDVNCPAPNAGLSLFDNSLLHSIAGVALSHSTISAYAAFNMAMLNSTIGRAVNNADPVVNYTTVALNSHTNSAAYFSRFVNNNNENDSKTKQDGYYAFVASLGKYERPVAGGGMAGSFLLWSNMRYATNGPIANIYSHTYNSDSTNCPLVSMFDSSAYRGGTTGTVCIGTRYNQGGGNDKFYFHDGDLLSINGISIPPHTGTIHVYNTISAMGSYKRGGSQMYSLVGYDSLESCCMIVCCCIMLAVHNLEI